MIIDTIKQEIILAITYQTFSPLIAMIIIVSLILITFYMLIKELFIDDPDKKLKIKNKEEDSLVEQFEEDSHYRYSAFHPDFPKWRVIS